jgi:hypothetical protein
VGRRRQHAARHQQREPEQRADLSPRPPAAASGAPPLAAKQPAAMRCSATVDSRHQTPSIRRSVAPRPSTATTAPRARC